MSDPNYKTLIDNSKASIEYSSFKKAHALKTAIEEALLEHKLSLREILINGGIDEAFTGLLSIDSNPKVLRYCFACLETSHFLGKDDTPLKINEELFDKAEYVQYFYPIMIECIRTNIMPLVGFLTTLSSNSAPILQDLKSKFLNTKSSSKK